MTKQETMTIIDRIRKLYISQSRQFTNSDWQSMIETWHDMFRNDTYEDINKALSSYANKGKQFMPSAPDIIKELNDLDDPETRKLFDRLCKECEKLTAGLQHVVIDDLGGMKRDPESPTGWRYVVAEAHVTSNYTQTDFAAMPLELQMFAEDIEGLRALDREIKSNDRFAYMRFKDRISTIRRELKAQREEAEKKAKEKLNEHRT